jgi:hypothetical protein
MFNMWQDYVLTAASISFSYALIPQVWYGYKNKIKTITNQTGIITTAGLTAMAATLYTLDLDLSTITTATAAGLWGTLTLQSFKYKGGLEKKIDSTITKK